MDIQRIENFSDKDGRRITKHIEVGHEDNVMFIGHGFVPVPAVRQMIPFTFPIIAVDVKEAYAKYDDEFKVGAEDAKKKIQDEILKQSSQIITPGGGNGSDNIVGNILNPNNVAGN